MTVSVQLPCVCIMCTWQQVRDRSKTVCSLPKVLDYTISGAHLVLCGGTAELLEEGLRAAGVLARASVRQKRNDAPDGVLERRRYMLRSSVSRRPALTRSNVHSISQTCCGTVKASVQGLGHTSPHVPKGGQAWYSSTT